MSLSKQLVLINYNACICIRACSYELEYCTTAEFNYYEAFASGAFIAFVFDFVTARCVQFCILLLCNPL